MAPIDELEPCDDATRAEGEARELELEDQALEMYPEIWKLGTFGDPAFESALEAAVDTIDGHLDDGSDSTASDKLKLDLEWLGLEAA